MEVKQYLNASVTPQLLLYFFFSFFYLSVCMYNAKPHDPLLPKLEKSNVMFVCPYIFVVFFHCFCCSATNTLSKAVPLPSGIEKLL